MKILFAADFLMRYFKEYIGDEAIDKLVSEVKPYFVRSDYSMVNLETIYNNDFEPIVKHGPAIYSVPETVYALKAMGADLVGMANNHAGDYGDEALFYTLDLLDKNGIAHIGAGKNIDDAYKSHIFEKDGIRVSVVAVCENEYGIATREKAGSAGFELRRVYNKICEEKKKSDFVVLFFHGGNEENPYPSPEKSDLYKLFCDFGVDAVVAMHTHCPQGWEMYNDKPIIYSMGNFYFPKDKGNLNSSFYFGYMTELLVEKSGIKVNIIPYHFTNEEIEVLKGERLEKFKRYLDEICKPLGDRKELERLFEGWSMITGPIYAPLLCYVPGMAITPDAMKDLKGVMRCEAHNELMRAYFSVLFDGKIGEAEKCAEEIKKMQRIEIY